MGASSSSAVVELSRINVAVCRCLIADADDSEDVESGDRVTGFRSSEGGERYGLDGVTVPEMGTYAAAAAIGAADGACPHLLGYGIVALVCCHIAAAAATVAAVVIAAAFCALFVSSVTTGRMPACCARCAGLPAAGGGLLCGFSAGKARSGFSPASATIVAMTAFAFFFAVLFFAGRGVSFLVESSVKGAQASASRGGDCASKYSSICIGGNKGMGKSLLPPMENDVPSNDIALCLTLAVCLK